MHTTNITILERQIEELVRAQVGAIERAAAAAVERACRRAPIAAAKRRTGAARSQAERAASQRRTPEELSALAEQLYQAICAHPGAPMSELAAKMGATPRELNLPAKQLRLTGRIRSAGQRSATRYFPRIPKAAASS
jgi:acyl-CoA reductase-like NAD-dependent aldehyde dehydrogenase